MRISDWSSDVCSSDLLRADGIDPVVVDLEADETTGQSLAGAFRGATAAVFAAGSGPGQPAERERSEERRVGTAWSVRVDIGGRRTTKNTHDIQPNTLIHPHVYRHPIAAK